MNYRNLLLALIAALLTVSSYAAAQEEEAPPAPKPPKQAEKKEPEAAPVIPKDPAVRAILDSPAKTPADQLEATRTLLSLGYPDLAKTYLKKLVDAKLDTPALAALVEKFGTAELLQFARQTELGPDASRFVDAALAAAAKLASDPARLAKFVAQLSDANKANRQAAMLAFVRAHGAAVRPLLKALADRNREPEHAAIRTMLLRLGSDAVEPLIGSIGSPQDANVADLAVALLGDLRSQKAVPAIVAYRSRQGAALASVAIADTALRQISGSAPTPAAAKVYLEHEARKELDRAKLIDSQDNYGGEPATVEIWRWDAASGQCTLTVEPAANAARRNAVRASRAVYQLSGGTPAEQNRYGQLHLLALLEDAKYANGLDQPLPTGAGSAADEAAQFGAAALDELLATAMVTGHPAAATAAAEILGRIGTLSLLERPDGNLSPLADAAWHGDRRLRFAAMDAILKLQPIRSFAGASHVGQSLGYFAGTSGARKALVVHPRMAASQQLGAQLSGLGYDATIAQNGREAFELAVKSPDFEFAIIHSAIDRPRMEELVSQFRKDPRTSRLPIAIIAMPEFPGHTEYIARALPYTTAVSEPQDAAAVKSQVVRLLGMPGCTPVSPEARRQQAIASIDWLVKLADDTPQWLDIRAIVPQLEKALYVPDLSLSTISALAGAGTAASQRDLLEMVGRSSLPAVTREWAAVAFTRGVLKHGILLTSDEIIAQYDRYNENAGRDAETHKVLQTVIEAIEQRNANAPPGDKVNFLPLPKQ